MLKRIAFVFAAVLACSVTARADGATETAKKHPLVGTWEGSVSTMGGPLRAVFKIQQTAEGGLTATMDSPDQDSSGIPVAKVTADGAKVTLDVAVIRGSYEGTLDAGRKEISGTWRQSGQELPLVLKKELEAK